MTNLLRGALIAAMAMSSMALDPVEAAASVDEPKYIRVCERNPCTGPHILLLKFETEYLREVLPNEWPCSWEGASVRAGAIAARTYAWWRVEHPRSSGFDLYGSSLDQNWDAGSAHPLCDARMEATAGTRVEHHSHRAFAAYRAETGDPTADADRPYLVPVHDRHTAQQTTGPGVCQRGSQDMATRGASHGTILRHYYTGISVADGAQVFLSETYSCTRSGRNRTETWQDTSDGSRYTRTYPAGPCVDRSET